jgi:hypothetical protein
MRLNRITVDDADLQERGTGESGLRMMMGGSVDKKGNGDVMKGVSD